jgi:hypothetical protein
LWSSPAQGRSNFTDATSATRVVEEGARVPEVMVEEVGPVPQGKQAGTGWRGARRTTG